MLIFVFLVKKCFFFVFVGGVESGGFDFYFYFCCFEVLIFLCLYMNWLMN